jgi:hypothetical protein
MLVEVPPRDPIGERDRAKHEMRRALAQAEADRAQSRQTVARVARAYHERVIESTRSAKHGREWISSLERLVPPAIWHAPVAEVTGPALLDALTALNTRVAVTTSRIRQRLDAVFAEAMFRGLCTSNPAAAIWAAAGFMDTLLRWKMIPEVPHGNETAVQQRVQA